MIVQIKVRFAKNPYSSADISKSDVELDCECLDNETIRTIGYAIVDSAIRKLPPSEETPLPPPDAPAN